MLFNKSTFKFQFDNKFMFSLLITGSEESDINQSLNLNMKRTFANLLREYNDVIKPKLGCTENRKRDRIIVKESVKSRPYTYAPTKIVQLK